MITYTKQLPIIARPDVLVCGAGLAGIGAAVAAARSGARESRRILGDYVLTGDDVAEGRRHDDVIVLGAWRLDRHPPRDSGYHEIPWTPPYDIPYGFADAE